MLETLTPHQLIDIADGDPFVRTHVLGGRVTRGPWAYEGAYIWGVDHRGDPGVVGIGDPRAAARLLGRVAADQPEIVGVSLPRGWVDHVDPDLTVRISDHWDWFAITDPPARRPDEDLVTWVEDADDEINDLLRVASPETSTWPGDDRARRWAGIRSTDGRLVAVLADTSRNPSIGHISSVATDPAHRRKGYGAALTTWITRRFFAEGAEMVTLGMYAGNDAARALYERLGFTCHHRFTAGALDRATALSPSCD